VATRSVSDTGALQEAATPAKDASAPVLSQELASEDGLENGAKYQEQELLGPQGPLTQHEQAVLTQASKKTERFAKKALQAAQLEEIHGRKRLFHQAHNLVVNSNSFDPFTEYNSPRKEHYVDDSKPAVRVGEYVDIKSDLSIKGRARNGGAGVVIALSNESNTAKATVRYMIEGGVEKGIRLDRIVVTSGFSTAERRNRPSAKRKRLPPDKFNPTNSEEQKKKQQKIQTISSATRKSVSRD